MEGNRFQVKNQSLELQLVHMTCIDRTSGVALNGGRCRVKERGKGERKAIDGKAINRYANWEKSSDYMQCIIG